MEQQQPIQDGRQDFSYLNYFGVDPSESSFGPLDTRHIDYVSLDTSEGNLAQQDPRLLSPPQWGSTHGRRSNEYYSDNSPGKEVKDVLELYNWEPYLTIPNVDLAPRIIPLTLKL